MRRQDTTNALESLDDFFERLTGRERACGILYFEYEFHYEEIGRVLGVSRESVNRDLEAVRALAEAVVRNALGEDPDDQQGD